MGESTLLPSSSNGSASSQGNSSEGFQTGEVNWRSPSSLYELTDARASYTFNMEGSPTEQTHQQLRQHYPTMASQQNAMQPDLRTYNQYAAQHWHQPHQYPYMMQQPIQNPMSHQQFHR